MKKSLRERSIEHRFLKILMLLRGVDERELARLTGFKLSTIQNIVMDTMTYPGGQRAIERVLDVAIWSDSAAFNARRRKHLSA